MYNVGRLCIKIAGRDARKKCVIIDVLDNIFVMIDGETRRRKCNIAHLEPLEQKLDIKKGASEAEVSAVFKKDLKIDLVESKPRKAGDRPRKQRKTPEQLHAQKEGKKKEKQKLQPVAKKAVDELAKKIEATAGSAVKTEAKPAPKKDEPKTDVQKEAEVKDLLKGE